MSFTDGEFEGYLTPASTEVELAIRNGVVVLDTNVLLDLYSQTGPVRELALSCIRSIRKQVWVPHQVVREFWRNRPAALLALKNTSNPLVEHRQATLAFLNRLSLSVRPDANTATLKEEVSSKLTQIEEALTVAAGEPINWRVSLADPSSDPIVSDLIEIFGVRVGEALEDEISVIEEGLKRFERKQPPGYKDGPRKRDQIPEHGTGDYLLWEQTLRYVETLKIETPFVIVTGDEKEDWRQVFPHTDIISGARQELVREARTRTGQPVFVVSPQHFYEVAHRSLDDVDESTAALLIESAGVNDGISTDWSERSYVALLDRLRAEGYAAQAEAIVAAAVNGDCFVSRSQIYRLGGYAETRSLRRFSLPATRVMLGLVEEGQISEGAMDPLTAIYDGPGRTIGYQVPDVFSTFSESKSAVVASIAQLIGFPETALTTGSKEPLSLIRACAEYLGFYHETMEGWGKPELAQLIFENSGHRWNAEFVSVGAMLKTSCLLVIRQILREALSEG